MGHERLERALKMNRQQFKRRTGVYPETFAEMEAVLTQREEQKKKRGRPAALSVAEQLLLTLEFWREYRTFAHLGDDWGMHETTVRCTVERVEAALLASQQFRLPGKGVLKDSGTVYGIIRPRRLGSALRTTQKNQRRWYSGKKKRHTLKMQVLVNVATHMIMCVASTVGSMHDLTLFRYSGVRLPVETALMGDAGYQGIWKDHPHAITPHKATRTTVLTDEQRQDKRVLAHTRQCVEHVIRRLKIFRVLKEVYRHRMRRFALRLHLIAALCNLSLARSA